MLGIKTKDRIERRVSAAVSAVQSGKRWRMLLAYQALSPLETGDVLAELFLMVEDLTSGVDESALLQAAKISEKIDAPRILRAVAATDVVELQAATGSDRLEKVFATLLVLVAALKDARARLDTGKA
jgi:hypothetical protein